MRRSHTISRAGAALVCCLLASHCARLQPVSLAQLFGDAVKAQRRGDYETALGTARQGRDRSAAGSFDRWRFWLLEQEIQMSVGRARQVEPFVSSPLPPSVPRRDELEGRRLMVLGWALSDQNRYDGSLQALGQALRVARALPLSPQREALLAQIEIVRASTLGRTAPDSPEEQQSALAALQHARAANDSFHEASALGTLGYLLLLKGRYEEALYRFLQVLPLAHEHRSDSLLALTLDNIGWCWFRLGELDRAQRYFEQSSGMYVRMGKLQNLHVNLGDQGSAWMERGDLEKAAPLFERAAGIAHDLGDQPAEADWLLNLAGIRAEQGRAEEAAGYLRRVESLRFESAERQTPAWLAYYRGRVAELSGDLSRAAAEYDSVLTLVIGEPSVLFEARARLARLAAARGDLAAADRQFRALLATVEERREGLSSFEARISWFARLVRYHKDYVQFLWRQGRQWRAMEVAESSRARALADASGRDGRRAMPVAGIAERAKRSRCSIASYWLGDEESYVWLFPANGKPSFRKLPPRRELAADISAVRRQIEGLRDPTLHPALARLSTELLVGDLLDGSGCLVVAPDQELYGLNFETLLVNDRYLVESTEVRVTPSLTLQPAAGRSGDGLLLFGDPLTPPQSRLPELAKAGQELTAIARLYPEAAEFRRAAATPQAFLHLPLSRYDLVHIAAHATANRESPLDSAIILSESEGRYQLTAREIAALEMRARLVSLSACHSAGVRSYAGEGTVGLAWSFLHAGASNVIAGLWAIDDQSSSRLLQQTYAGLKAGTTPARALRAAKLSFLSERGALRKPFYWAPFQLYSWS